MSTEPFGAPFLPNKPRPSRARIDAAKEVIQQTIFDLSNADQEDPPDPPHRVVNGAVLLVNCGRRASHSEIQWAVSELQAGGFLHVRFAKRPQFISDCGQGRYAMGSKPDGGFQNGEPVLGADQTPLGLVVLQTTDWLFFPELSGGLARGSPAEPLVPGTKANRDSFQDQMVAAYDHGLVSYDAIKVLPGLWVKVTGYSCKVITGDCPTLCPDARPGLPSSMLGTALRAVRRMNQLPPGTTIHWVGHETGVRNRCKCHPEAPYAAPFDKERWPAVTVPAPPPPLLAAVAECTPDKKSAVETANDSEPGPPQHPVAPPVGDRSSARRLPDPTTEFCLYPESGGFYVCGWGGEGRFPNLRGLRTLRLLVRSPGQPVPWVDLDPAVMGGDPRSAQPAMDAAAVAAARIELNRLREEIEGADNDVDRADSQRRYDELAATLQSEIGPGGRTRDLNSLLDRIRPKIAGRLKTVYERFRAAEPPLKRLADHFESTISSTPSGFVYSPRDPIPNWRTEEDQK